MTQSTPIYGFRTPDAVGAPNNVPADLRTLALDVEADLKTVDDKATAAVQHTEGPLSGRPAPAGNAGRMWIVKGDPSPLLNGLTYISDGTTWVPMSDASPVGAEMYYYGTTDPAGWLIEDGRELSRTTYARLFAVIGTSAGAGNGTTTFNLPNAKGKVLVGRDAAQPEFATLGQTGGEKAHTLTVAEMPLHTHVGAAFNMSSVPYQGGASSSLHFGQNPPTHPGYGIVEFGTNPTGGNGPHNNLQPYTVRNVIIRV